MTDVDHDTLPAAAPVANPTPGPMPVDAAPTPQPEPTFVVPPTPEAIDSGGSTEIGVSLTTADASIDRSVPDVSDCGGMGSGRDGGPPATASEAGEPEDTLHFQTYCGDLLVLRDVAATMLPTPVATEPGAQVEDTSVPCEVTLDGLRFTFSNGLVVCQVRTPFAHGTTPSGAGRFRIPAQILRLSALQVVKNKPKPKNASTRPNSSSQSLIPRAIYQGVPDKAAPWTITPQTSAGQLLLDNTVLTFPAPTDTNMPWEEGPELSEPVRILPDRLSAALRLTKTAAATRRDALPRWSQVSIQDGVACASNLRMYAFHNDNALDRLLLRVAESDISTLTSLMRHLDPAATTIRTSGRMCVIEDARLTIRFEQPFDSFPVIKPLSLLKPTLAFQCEYSAIMRLISQALIVAGSDPDAHRRLQLHLRVTLIDGQINLKNKTTWGKNCCENSLGSIILEPEQASDLRGRLSPSRSEARHTNREDLVEAPEQPSPAPAIELGRYVASDLLRAIRPLRSGLLRFDFIDNKALIVSETMAQHRTDYILVSGTQDETHGLPQRRSKRWDAPARNRN
ncbi:hypothetical protein ACLBX9_00150 [Methylobacterium sp. A49B]